MLAIFFLFFGWNYLLFYFFSAKLTSKTIWQKELNCYPSYLGMFVFVEGEIIFLKFENNDLATLYLHIYIYLYIHTFVYKCILYVYIYAKYICTYMYLIYSITKYVVKNLILVWLGHFNTDALLYSPYCIWRQRSPTKDKTLFHPPVFVDFCISVTCYYAKCNQCL